MHTFFKSVKTKMFYVFNTTRQDRHLHDHTYVIRIYRERT